MWIQLTIILLVVCLGIIAFLRFNFTIATVWGSSMYPTLTEGDRLLSLNFLPCLWLRQGQIVTGDINYLESLSSPELFADIDTISEPELAFENLNETEIENLPIEPNYSKFIKRIIGLPGDTICVPLSSLHEFMQTALRSRCDTEGNLVWTVPENHCFVRGDGLISMDSLTVGPIPLSAITGIAIWKLPRHSDIDTVKQLREIGNEA